MTSPALTTHPPLPITLLLLRTLWLWVKQTRRRWSSSARNSMRPWERAGQPKSTGWPTMWPKTTAPRAAESPRRPGVRGQEDTVKECVSAREGNGVLRRRGGTHPGLKKGIYQNIPNMSRFSPIYCTYRRNVLSETVQLACIPPRLAWHGASWKPKFTVFWHFCGIMLGKVVASFAQAQQLVEHAAKGRELKHPLCPH